VSPAGQTGGGRPRRNRRGAGGPVRRFPRAERINEVLRQVLAEEIERLVDTDERLTLLTITAVETDRDLRHATLLFSRLGPTEVEALGDARVRLQATVARQVRLKWTPLLSFEQDPAIVGGQRVEDILRDLKAEESRRRPVVSDGVAVDDNLAVGAPGSEPEGGGPGSEREGVTRGSRLRLAPEEIGPGPDPSVGPEDPPSGSGDVPSGSGDVPSGSGDVPSGSGDVPSGSGGRHLGLGDPHPRSGERHPGPTGTG
jgi:ribosome-binding factor A